MLLLPVVLLESALKPVAVLPLPVVLFKSVSSPVAVLVSPVVLLAVTEVTKYLAKEVLGPAVVRGGSATVRAIRRLFHLDRKSSEAPSGESVEPLTDEQWAKE